MGKAHQFLSHRGCNCFRVLKDLLVGEAEHAKAFACHPLVAGLILAWIDVMRMPVEFHDKPQLAAQEVGKIRPDRHLAAELRAELRT